MESAEATHTGPAVAGGRDARDDARTKNAWVPTTLSTRSESDLSEPTMPIMVKDGIVGRSAIRIIPGPVLEQLVAWAPQDRDAASEQSGEVVERGVLDGEAFITAFGQVLGVYTWDPPSVPNLEQIQGAVAGRAASDCARFRLRPRKTRLIGWHGGWTPEGVGIFAAEIYGASKRGPGRTLGRVSVVIRTPIDRGVSIGHGIAC